MAFVALAVNVPPNSANIQEAKERVFDFFKMACRSIPTIMDIYILDDVVTVSQLRTTIASEIRLVNGLKLLQPIKDQYSGITYADLFQLASATAVEEVGGLKIPTKYGRVDVSAPEE